MDPSITLSVLLASFVVAIVSLVGTVFLYVPDKNLQIWLPRLVAVAVGVLLGDAFLHLIPEALELSSETSNSVVLWILVGIVAFFFMESTLHWHHDHNLDNLPNLEKTPATFARMNLLGDATHNFVDGVLIASSFLVTPSLGIATTIAIVLHEIPQEISDIAVLMQGGYDKKRAIFLNFCCATMCTVGATTTLIVSQLMELGLAAMLAFTAGGFIYIATSDLVPLLRSNELKIRLSSQFTGTLLGILSMQSILWFEDIPLF